MCGIFGEVGKYKTPQETFRDLNNLSSKRGPDAEGYWTDNNLCRMGFRRLAILDLSAEGNQPMTSLNGEWVMVMNGEVYNYKELYKELGSPVLRSHTDTEVVVNIFEHFGVKEGVKKLNGMFAIGLYHISKKELYLIRDFAGIKPLFYGIKNGNCVFASQFNQLFKHPLFANDLKLRPQIIKEFFGLGYMHVPNTVFENIFQIKPGEFLHWNANEGKLIGQTTYYSWNENPFIDESSPQTTLACNELLQTIVSDQLQSDVPVATFLSGGIDSPLVTAHAHQLHPKIKAYTFGLDDKQLNESEIAKQYAELLGVKQVVENSSEHELQEMINEHFQNTPEPFGDYSSIPTYLITQKAKKHATVMLSGDGGDELFWGYPRFIRSVKQAWWFAFPLGLRKIIMPVLRRISPKLSYALQTTSEFGTWILSKQIHYSELDLLFPNTDFSTELKSDYTCHQLDKQSILLFLKRNEFYGHLQKVLRKVDLMSMANSLEVRVPLLDKRMITFSNNLNPQLGIQHLNPKILLKNCLATFITENKVYRHKNGFTVPIKTWMKGSLQKEIKQLTINTPIYGAEYFNSAILQKQVENFFEGKDINAWGLWHVYAWQKWAQENRFI